MANRSLILLEGSRGKLKGVYCHWDGNPEGVGKNLINYYATKERIEELFSFSDIINLKRNIYGNEDVCEFYARDRGEPKHQLREYKNTADIITKHQFEEYNYIFGRDGKWRFFENKNFQNLQEVETYLKNKK